MMVQFILVQSQERWQSRESRLALRYQSSDAQKVGWATISDLYCLINLTMHVYKTLFLPVLRF